MAVIIYFLFVFVNAKNGSRFQESMHQVTLRGTLAFSGDYQRSFKALWDSSAASFCGELLLEPSMSARFGRCCIIPLYTLHTGKWHYISGTAACAAVGGIASNKRT